MTHVFHHSLAMPLWATAFFMVALIASPPATLFLMLFGLTLLAFAAAGRVPWLRPALSVVRVSPERHRGGAARLPAAGLPAVTRTL